jgi:hypothetical protein
MHMLMDGHPSPPKGGRIVASFYPEKDDTNLKNMAWEIHQTIVTRFLNCRNRYASKAVCDMLAATMARLAP